MSSSSTNTRFNQRPHPARRDFASNTTEGSQRRSRRPPRHPGPGGNHVTTTDNGNGTRPGKPKPRPTHFLALPIGHHAALRSTISALTSSWLAHEPPVDGLDPSIVVHPRRLHLTLGTMALAPPNNHNRDRDREQEQEQDLAGATRLLASLAPGIRALLEHSLLRIPLGRLAVMQPDPARAHVLYVEPDLRSPEGRRLRAVCGACPASLNIPLPRATTPDGIYTDWT
jgi:activating signal cointegrator complex subunit 1